MFGIYFHFLRKHFANLGQSELMSFTVKSLIVLIVCFLLPVKLLLTAQDYKASVALKGQVVDSVSGTGIAYMQIFNESTRRFVISDTAGHFEIELKGTDTLVFTCLGYLGKVHIIHVSYTGKIQIIRLIPYIYPIEEVSISKYRDYKQFQKEFLLVQPEQKLEIAGLPKPKYRETPTMLDTNYLRSSEFLVFHPISFLYYNFSKEEKSKRKVYYLQRQQREQVLIDRKYNRELIEKITGLSGEEITKFMWFCNFSHQFLYEASELEIVQKVDEKYQEYKQLNRNAGEENTLIE